MPLLIVLFRNEFSINTPPNDLDLDQYNAAQS